MALDWSKKISFSGLKKASGKGNVTYPSKRYINLMPRKERNNDWRKVLPVAIILFVLLAVFVKFGVYDLFANVSAKQAELNSQTQVLRSVQAKAADYDQVKEEYDAYQSTRLSSAANEVSAIEAMELVDAYIAPYAHIDEINYDKNTITLNLSNITLENVGKLVSKLYEQPIVKNVAVSTAGQDSSKNEELTAAMVISVEKA